ncbi:MAG: S-layer family protein [Leptolyngbyaceae cyanobacterium SL_7_1]|nr:S-layer family protein [Leptolyngbyaceae cyanobacterium SL_7_1]
MAIDTRHLAVRDGGVISVDTFGRGDAGELIITAAESVNVLGTSSSGENASFIRAGTGRGARGEGGDLTIRTGQFTVEAGAEVTVSSPDGQAGNLTLSANAIRLDRGRLTAETGASGDDSGANITLQGLDSLVMRDRSLISAEANGTANGGNITLEAADGFIIATPSNTPGSDIIANADRGNGGTVNITAQSLLGIDFRDRPTPDNDITASSRVGLAGTVGINTPEIDPSRGLAELPTNLTDATTQIVRSCGTNPTTANELGNFVITGRGGLPINPAESLESEAVLTEWVTGEGVEDESLSSSLPVYAPPVDAPIVEAETIAIAPNGQIALTAQAAATADNSWQSPSCTAPYPSSRSELRDPAIEDFD